MIHIHNPSIWQGMLKDNLPHTAVDIPYGTLEMAMAFQQVIGTLSQGWLAMKAAWFFIPQHYK